MPTKAKTAKPAVKAEKPAKPVAEMHGIKAAYSGASQPIRGHGKKLSPVRINNPHVPNTYTARDAAMLSALYEKHGTAAFKRLDCDAGALSRLIGHGYLKHVSGNADERDCTFAVTPRAVTERFKTATAAAKA